MTRPDKTDFPREILNKGAIAGDSRGTAISTILDNKVHCFIWLDNKAVFLWTPSTYSTVPRGLPDGTCVQITCYGGLQSKHGQST